MAECYERALDPKYRTVRLFPSCSHMIKKNEAQKRPVQQEENHEHEICTASVISRSVAFSQVQNWSHISDSLLEVSKSKRYYAIMIHPPIPGD